MREADGAERERCQAMVAAANAADCESAIGFVVRRSPAVTAIREIVNAGGIGQVLHFNGRYWCD
jgi:predicted dehydrogenase